MITGSPLYDSMGNKEFWAKTRREIEREGQDSINNLRGQRADVNKLHSTKSFAKWRIKSMSGSLKADIEHKRQYTQGLLDVHKERVQEALSESKPVPAEVLKDYPELARKEEPKPDDSLARAYYDWVTSNAYLSTNGYRLKSDRKRIAPWNKAVLAKYPDTRYGDGNTRFHNDAQEWAKGRDLQKYDFERLQDVHQDRGSVARRVDSERANKITVEPYDPKAKRWKRDPGSMDVLGVDSPPSVTKPTRMTRITPRMPKLR